MKQYSAFIFEAVSWNPHARKIVLRYSLDHSITFEETLILPDEALSADIEQRQPQIDAALKALHIIGGISYYKTCLPKKLEISGLSKFEGRFWDTVYERGLGEFFYRNNIDFRSLIHFPVSTEKIEAANTMRKNDGVRPLKRILVPVGGGKDSVVTMELLKKSGAKLTLLRLGSHPLIDELASVSGLPMLTVKRSLSPNLFDLNAEGALNGHVPITAYLSILCVLIALLYDFDAVAMSNEQSASEGNVKFKGMEINHQWSKSLEFEKLLRRLVTESFGSNIEYFSALRPYSELRISELFAGYPQYFDSVTSCNKNWKILSKAPVADAHDVRIATGHEAKSAEDGGAMKRLSAAKSASWCGTCPKCAFVFATLAAFLPKKTLEKIFGSIFFENDALIPLYQELLGVKDFKPFECVGTAEETKAAFLLAHKRGELEKSPVMQMFVKDILPGIRDPKTLIKETLTSSKDHVIPKSILPVLP